MRVYGEIKMYSDWQLDAAGIGGVWGRDGRACPPEQRAMLAAQDTCIDANLGQWKYGR